MRPKENDILQEHVKVLIWKERESMSPYAMLALLVPKRDGDRRMCVDNMTFNKIIVKYRFLIPLIDDMFDTLSRAKIFLKSA